MIPVLYPTTETEFTSNGIGHLNDAITCTVTEERNGAFELEITYPISGNHFKDIGQRSLILAKPSVLQDPQPFRVYKISKPINGICTINAEHISYDLSGIPISTIDASSCAGAMSALETASSGWTFWTDKTTQGRMQTFVPCSVRSLLGGTEGSILDVYGGEWKWDKFLCKLYATRGADKGVQIRYGKNLTDLTQEENCASLYTAVLCYWHKEENGVHSCIQGTKNVTDVFPERTYSFSRTLIVDVSSEYDEAPTQATLQSRAETYIRQNNVGVPTISLTVSFVMLGQTEEYKDLHLLENVELCDTISVLFEQLGVNAKAQVYKTTYNVLLDRYESIELGDKIGNIADTIADQQYEIDHPQNSVTVDMMQEAISSATSAITGNSGGYVVMRDANADGHPEEILIMDQPTIATATKVWRWNQNGLGYSSTGINGNYTTAITANGEIVADFITAGTLSANIIKAGILTSEPIRVISYSTVGLTSVNEEAFFNYFGQVDGIKCEYNGGWTYNGGSINLADAGITFQGIPHNGDYLVCIDAGENGNIVTSFNVDNGELTFILGNDNVSNQPVKMMCSTHGVSFYCGGQRFGGLEGLELDYEDDTAYYSKAVHFYTYDANGRVNCDISEGNVKFYGKISAEDYDHFGGVDIRACTDGGRIDCKNTDGTTALVMGITSNGSGAIVMGNDNDHVIVRIYDDGNGGHISVGNDEEEDLAVMGVGAGGRGYFELNGDRIYSWPSP